MLDFSFANILHSNVINFAIMIALFGYIAYKLDFMQKIEDMRASIQKKVEESDTLKADAIKEFDSVKELLGNVEAETQAIVKKAQDTANTIEQKTKEELDKSVELIRQNVQKQVDSEEKQVQGELLKSVSSSSIEIAQRQIKTALDKDKELHRKYIEDFINSIDKIDV